MITMPIPTVLASHLTLLLLWLRAASPVLRTAVHLRPFAWEFGDSFSVWGFGLRLSNTTYQMQCGSHETKEHTLTVAGISGAEAEALLLCCL